MSRDTDAPWRRSTWDDSRGRPDGNSGPFVSSWGRNHLSHMRPSQETPVDLTELRGPAPAPPLPPPSPRPVVEPSPWIEIVLRTDDGAPLANVRVQVTNGFGYDQEHASDADGRIRVDVPEGGSYQIHLVEVVETADVPLQEPPIPMPASALGIFRDDLTTYVIGVERPVTIVVARDRATIVSLDGWLEGCGVLTFGVVREVPDGVVTVRGILQAALSRRIVGAEIYVIGHADTEGSAADNADLAAVRARSVALYLTGDRDGWAAHACANADMRAFQSALRWAALTAGVACDPGVLDGDWGPATAEALNGLRTTQGVSLEQPYGVADWAAIYDLYDASLAALMYCSTEGLRAIKAELQVIEDSLGEAWPIEAPELDEHECPANRRVDIVIVPRQGGVLESADEIYDGTYDVRHHVAGAEVLVKLFTVTPGMVAVGLTKLDVQIGSLRALLSADMKGIVEFTALAGDALVVRGCTDPWGSSTYLWGMTPESVKLL
jgi:hypothetical protein